ncbi:hypothetical protein [Paracoccus siganidrum]|uniref:hypothetical protein n=1 Tax=Paracoccus siganidrum TaxID=1276757 RepID=UPI00160521CC|nr:hypothetical protein [Paracoccus siganidrum]
MAAFLSKASQPAQRSHKLKGSAHPFSDEQQLSIAAPRRIHGNIAENGKKPAPSIRFSPLPRRYPDRPGDAI